MSRSSTCKFWQRGFLSAYLEGTDEKNAEARFYKGVGRRPVEKFKSVHSIIATTFEDRKLSNSPIIRVPAA